VVIGAIIIATVAEPAISTALGTDEQHLVVKGPVLGARCWGGC
jgi:hypothetical protein